MAEFLYRLPLEKDLIHQGEKITIEIENSEIKIVSVDNIIDEMHKIFTKNQIDKNISIVDDFIAERRQEYLMEEKKVTNVQNNI
ncbi:Transcriptional regulator [Rickettsia akari str. Hartford]|uniref:Transcriptional regulator n=1 Tax=Rickettsia akari (strain Hartford) TaxID=293614 RepID=A8GPP2_RICAH|nr:hypothetical protein [Rickettsia akari]ABV75367.1 Transcriptional regulator [Rickettsia akari str. Hartford]